MAITAGFIVSYNIGALAEVFVQDNSIFSNVLISSVNATRFKFATVNSTNAPQTDVDEVLAGYEYEVISGSFESYGRTFVAGDIFILYNNVTLPSSGVQVDQTGYYAPVTTYLPADTTPVSFLPSQTGQSNITYYNDEVFTCIYELYTTKSGAGSVTVSGDTQFIVIGTQGDYIEIGSEQYYVGEVFVKDATFTFSNGSGTNYVVEYDTESTGYFRTWYYNYTLWKEYFSYIATTYQQPANIIVDFNNVTARINQCAIYEEQQFGVSLAGINDLQTDINTNYQLKV